MKRAFVVLILGMFLVSMMVSALNKDGTPDGADDLLAGLEPVVESGDSWFKDGFSNAKTWTVDNLKFTDLAENSEQYVGWLYALLLGMIIYTIISTFFAGSSKWVQWTITGAITAIAMIGIPGEVIASLESSYGAMGSAILAMIPFVIIFWFSIKVDNYALAKGTWLFFGLYYLAFALIGFSGSTDTEGWPYLIGLIGCVAMFYFIGFFRKKTKALSLTSQIEKARTTHNKRAAAFKQFDKTVGDISGIDVE